MGYLFIFVQLQPHYSLEADQSPHVSCALRSRKPAIKDPKGVNPSRMPPVSDARAGQKLIKISRKI